MYHTPVLLDESIKGLNISPGGVYVDATFGGGGHSREILARLGTGRLIAFDRDGDAVANALNDERFLLIQADYRYIKNFLRLHESLPCDGILADLGISSHQIDEAARGFSTRFAGELDMRMDKRNGISAADIVNDLSVEDLSAIFRNYGELRNSFRLAAAIVQARTGNRISTTGQLQEIARTCAPRGQENKYLAQVFQAIRIEVNRELESLEEFLQKGFEALKPGGRMAVISYHSLEDRLVKNFFKSGNTQGTLEQDFFGNVRAGLHPVNRKPILAGKEETERNPRARSAKLRIAEKEQA